MERLNYSEIFDKKSPIYYLKLEAQQEKSLLNEKNINKFLSLLVIFLIGYRFYLITL